MHPVVSTLRVNHHFVRLRLSFGGNSSNRNTARVRHVFSKLEFYDFQILQNYQFNRLQDGKTGGVTEFQNYGDFTCDL